jgi:hypothetical protein
MSVTIQPLIGRTISDLISLTYGPILQPKEADVLDYCQKMGEISMGYVDDELVCCWGLVPPSFLSTQAYLWMWCANDVVSHQFVFIRQSQLQVKKMLERYETINGHCLVGSKAKRWLKWLGAEFSYPEDGKISFVIRRANG